MMTMHHQGREKQEAQVCVRCVKLKLMKELSREETLAHAAGCLLDEMRVLVFSWGPMTDVR